MTIKDHGRGDFVPRARASSMATPAPIVIVGVTGSIAAFKAADVVSTLVQDGYDVHVVLTHAARHFITPATFQALSGHPVLCDPFEAGTWGGVEHIRMAERARCLCIAPATANVIAKLAAGLADDMLTILATAVTCPILVAPAMNARMYEYRVTQRNIRTLKDLGFQFVAPGRGWLACGASGIGRLAEPAAIVAAVRKACGRRAGGR
jgi:phosphopantothenoylcysteine decarboxylase/phosphopantothenate--cysteine ligase